MSELDVDFDRCLSSDLGPLKKLIHFSLRTIISSDHKFYEDAFQSALIAVWKSGASASSYVITVARRAAIDELRKLTSKSKKVKNPCKDAIPYPWESYGGEDCDGRLAINEESFDEVDFYMYLDDLDFDDRESITVKMLIDGHTKREVAQVLDRDPAIVSNICSNLRSKVLNA